MKREELKTAARRRFSVKERSEIVAEYEQSNLTQKAFVERHGISVATLSNWLRCHRPGQNGTSKGVGFQAVDVSRMFGVQRWVAEVVMRDGAVLRLGEQASLRMAEGLMRVLRRAC